MTFYLCDLENVGSTWSNAIPFANEGDMFILFYTKAMGSITYDVFSDAYRKGITFSFVEHEPMGTNSMDFHIDTEIGHLSSNYPNESFVILSADKGYDSVVCHQSKAGVRVERVDPRTLLAECNGFSIQPADVFACKAQLLGSASLSAKRVYTAHVLACDIPDDCVSTVVEIMLTAMYAPLPKRKLTFRNMLRSHYGAPTGESYYLALKTSVHYLAEHGPYPSENEHDKSMQYLRYDGTRNSKELRRLLNDLTKVTQALAALENPVVEEPITEKSSPEIVQIEPLPLSVQKLQSDLAKTKLSLRDQQVKDLLECIAHASKFEVNKASKVCILKSCIGLKFPKEMREPLCKFAENYL